jgi:hypothetical protein
MALKSGSELILNYLLTRFGPNLTFEEAAIHVLRFKTAQNAYTAKNRGKFLLRIRDGGGRFTVSIYDVNEWLITGEPQQDSTEVPKVKRPGRPRKSAKLYQKSH